ncbi:histone-like nucleoid-structuring protein Lsr2 [Streptomyces sp. NPDC005281]|uniref:Lsr2 family DNA-binding protein n=1 Tax=Streptomyces sp. NPDC005281 TaxID=3155712 RepID=UPI0033A7C187
MRKTVVIEVEKTFCDACVRKGVEVEATEVLSLVTSAEGASDRAWDLCLVHSVTFGRYLIDTLGMGEGTVSEAAAESVSVPEVDEHQGVTEAEPEAVAEQPAEAAPVAEAERKGSVVVAGLPDDYSVTDYRAALTNLGYKTVHKAQGDTVGIIVGTNGANAVGKLLDASEKALPCLDTNEQPGAFRAAVSAGVLTFPHAVPAVAKVYAVRSTEPEAGSPEAIRAWAKANGVHCASKGRISAKIREAYKADAAGKADAA